MSNHMVMVAQQQMAVMRQGAYMGQGQALGLMGYSGLDSRLPSTVRIMRREVKEWLKDWDK